MATLSAKFDMSVRNAAWLPAGARKDDSLLVAIDGDGSVHRMSLDDGSLVAIGGGYTQPVALAASADGKRVYVADQIGRNRAALYEADADQTDRSRARPLAQIAGSPRQMVVLDNTLVIADPTTRALVVCDLGTLGVKRVATGLASPTGVAAAGENQVYVAESGASRVRLVELLKSRSSLVRLGLTGVQGLTSDPDGKRLVAAQQTPAGGIVSAYMPAAAPEQLADLGSSARPLVAWEFRNRLIVADERGIFWYDLARPVGDPVRIRLQDSNPFAGSYQRIIVDTGTSGLALEGLDFNFPDGEAAGAISLSQDDDSAPNEVMLLVGYAPGSHKLEVVDRATGTVVGRAEFVITTAWSDRLASPSRWNVGTLSDFTTGYTWGGGPGVPQNVDVIRQQGTRNICILTVDVSDARYPTGAAYTAIATRWFNGAVGTTPDADGKVRSARAYFNEISNGDFTLSLVSGAVQAISLATNWASNFVMMPTPWPGNSFQPVNAQAFAQACISAATALVDGSGNPLLDFQQIRTLILVVRSAVAPGVDNFFWPQAWGGSFTVPGGTSNIAVLGMPDDWDTVRDTRAIHETLAHEIGHNLGMPDLYTNANPAFTPQIQARDVTNFDLMSNDSELPSLSIGQKLELGWTRPEWVTPLDFSRSTIPFDQTFTLHAVELGAPPPGRSSAIEVRIADGRNYYFEYRSEQDPHIADQGLDVAGDTADRAVLGTEVLSQSFSFPIAQPHVVRLSRDPENENGFYVSGQNYRETDSTSPMAIADFVMDVLSTGDDSAQVRIRYGTNGRPDLSIRPWPGGDNWQSPDIEVRNDRATADPARWANVPWIGHANTVVARYRNRGPVTARNVRVEFFIKDFTVGGAPEALLGTDTRDVPPESVSPVVEFTTNWIPTSDGHRCVRVGTPLYIDTSVNPNIVELSDSNNSAQSNYTRYIAATSSPARRGITHVTLHNPFSQATDIYVIPQIRGEFARFYRLYLEHASLKLQPGESRKVRIMLESMFGDPRVPELSPDRINQKFFFEETLVSLRGYGIPPDGVGHPVLLGGVGIRVGSARGTRFDPFGWDPANGLIRGHVAVKATGAPAPGFVLLTFEGEEPRLGTSVKVPLDAQGNFTFRGGRDALDKFKAKKILGHYPGAPGYGPSDPEHVLAI